MIAGTGDHARTTRPRWNRARHALAGLLAVLAAFAGLVAVPQAAVAVNQPFPDAIQATIPGSSGPESVAVSPVDGRVWVANMNGRSVSVIDPADNSIVATIDIGGQGYGITVDPDGRAWLGNWDGTSVVMIDPADGYSVTKFTGTYESGIYYATAVAVSPVDGRVWVANYSNRASVIDPANGYSVTTFVTQGATGSRGPLYGVAVTPDGRVWISDQNDGRPNQGLVMVIDPTTDTVVDTISGFTNPGRLAVSPVDGRVWVADRGNNSVKVLDPTTNTVVETITGFNAPRQVTVGPDGRVWVADQGSSSVKMIDPADNSVTTITGVFNRASGVAVSPLDGRVWVANPGNSSNGAGSSVSVISRQFSVAFDLNGASGTAPTTQNVWMNETATAPTAPTRPGYDFLGWSTDPDGDAGLFDFDTPIADGPNTLYAQWERITHAVTFDGNGAGSGSVASITVNDLDAVTLPANGFIRAGYSFTGWSTQQTGGTVLPAGDSTFVPTGDTVFYAQWQANPMVSVTFDPDAADASGTMPDQTANVPTALTANAFQRPGYSFTGWATSSGGPVVYPDGASFPFDTASDTTLYAVWTALPVVTVTFDANASDATGTMPNQTANMPTALTSNGFQRTGWTFAGWGTSAGGPVVYEDGAVFPFDTATDTTLFAQWERTTYTVTFDLAGGTTATPPDPVTVAHGDTVTEPAAPSRTGYRFAGWSATTSSSGLWDFDTPVTGSMTLTALWEQLIFTVDFDLNGGDGSAPPAQTIPYGGTATEPDDPSRSGYAFLGWSATNTPDALFDFAVPVVDGPITLVAQWEQDETTPPTTPPPTPPGGGDGDGGGPSVDRGGMLATTGTELSWLLIGGAVAALLAGPGLVFASRRRKAPGQG